jgi:FkbM family methyltransferase
MSRTIARIIARVGRALASPLSRTRRAIALAHASDVLAPTWTVETRRGPIKFHCPTSRAALDPINFFKDEPETLRWIDEIVADGSCVWDIGANVGIYAIYAALKPGVEVVAFEPSAQTYATLNKNIELNSVGARVRAYCVALTNTTAADAFHMADTGSGHSMHSFGVKENVYGAFTPAFSQAMLGYSADDFRRTFGVRQPDHIKLDVDGLELLVLKGARQTLRAVKSLLVEVELPLAEATTKADIRRELEEAGFFEQSDFNQGLGRNRLFRNKST